MPKLHSPCGIFLNLHQTCSRIRTHNWDMTVAAWAQAERNRMGHMS